jgi:hypothetical protein
MYPWSMQTGDTEQGLLTSIYVATVVGTTKSSSSPSPTNAASSSPSTEVGGWRHFVVHGASHAKARVVRLNRESTGITHLHH